MQYMRSLTGLVLLVAALWGPAAHAMPITFEFSGKITQVADPGGLTGGAVVNDPFTGRLIFESTTPDSRPDDPTHGTYKCPGGSLVVQIGSLQLQSANPRIYVSLDSFGHSYKIVAELPLTIGNLQFEEFTAIEMGGLWSSLSLPDDSLPLSPPKDKTRNGYFGIRASDHVGGGLYVRGEVLSFTPEPSSIVLVCACLALAGRRSRKRRWDVCRALVVHRDAEGGFQC